MFPQLPKFWKQSRRQKSTSKKPVETRRTVRLNVEQLEDRTLPSSTASAMIGGVVFLDPSHIGVLQSSSAPIPGDTVTLTGTTTLGASVTATTTSDAHGTFDFLNVLPGTYQMSAGSVPGFLASGISVGAPLSVVGGQAYH